LNLWDWKISNIYLSVGNGQQPLQWLGYVACNYVAFENGNYKCHVYLNKKVLVNIIFNNNFNNLNFNVHSYFIFLINTIYNFFKNTNMKVYSCMYSFAIDITFICTIGIIATKCIPQGVLVKVCVIFFYHILCKLWYSSHFILDLTKNCRHDIIYFYYVCKQCQSGLAFSYLLEGVIFKWRLNLLNKI
jgi:hypothetical protein